MKNFPIYDKCEDRTFWVSRSIAVLGCVFTFINGKWCVLANKRGKGTPDFQGMWNMPCGYLDFDETILQAVVREVYEETGLKINPEFMHFWKFNDSPDSNMQNVTFRYFTIININNPDYTGIGTNNNRGGEENEVEDVKWISLDSIDNYEWAFNHNEIIKELSSGFPSEFSSVFSFENEVKNINDV